MDKFDVIKESVLREEIDLSKFIRETMLAVSMNAPKFNAFCQKLTRLPIEKCYSFAFDFFESIDGFPKIVHKPMKSSNEALKLKNLGNAAFGRGHFIVALKMYTQSVSVAPVGSSDLAVAFGNRSAALFELQRYEGCIVDINRALLENCLETSRNKLLNRKQKCLSKMMELNAAAVKFDHQESGCEMKNHCPIDEDALDLDYTEKFPIPKAKLKNRNISGASDKIKIAANSTFGRYIFAVEDIEIGEIIAIEKAYASILFKDCLYSHCTNCFLRCEALIPCPGCSSVMYCSRRCREDDFCRSHRIECQFFFYSNCLGLPLSSAFRLAIQTFMVITKQGENLKKLMNDPVSKDPLKLAPDVIPEKLCSENAVHRILSSLNDDRLYRYSDDLSTLSEAAQSSYRAIIMSYILRHTTYFDAAMIEKAEVNKDSTEERKYAGLLFFKLMISLPLYNLDIKELLQKKVSELLLHRDGTGCVGYGFYLFGSLFNHSCHHNVTRNQHKDTMVSLTTQPIKAGQQLFISYGAHFFTIPRNDRQKHFRMFGQYDCRCVACKEDWPLFNEMPNLMSSGLNLDTDFMLLIQYKRELDKFSNSPSGLIEYNTNSFDFFRKFLRAFHEKCKKPIYDHFIGFLMFELLLQSRGNNYVYTKDSVLMSL